MSKHKSGKQGCDTQRGIRVLFKLSLNGEFNIRITSCHGANSLGSWLTVNVRQENRSHYCVEFQEYKRAQDVVELVLNLVVVLIVVFFNVPVFEDRVGADHGDNCFEDHPFYRS